MRKVSIPNSKGQRLDAVIYGGGQEKLAILCPGYLDTKDYQHMVRLSSLLNEQGYTVASFDPTGTWGSEGGIVEYLTSQYLSDIKSVLEHMLLQGSFETVLLGGHSRGGQVSILYAAKDPRITQVFGIMPSSRPVEGERRRAWEEAGVSIGWREMPDDSDKSIQFAVPFTHVLDRDQFDTLGDVKKIRVPVILLAGELDITIPPKDVEALFENANEPKKYALAKGIDHEYRHNLEQIDEVNRLILAAL